ncbi:hypothetical protein DRE_04186 [Drechslerella stenobrocha 248]|uniref:Uncharacterized protein n=1 Tax=Drechslerella stenobrocha 248 TaxID=1043628 RepID=W7I2A7_9PEZI|nr:hypothetical protein DRE_04186 [Drechslerella stenobrocha 248]
MGSQFPIPGDSNRSRRGCGRGVRRGVAILPQLAELVAVVTSGAQFLFTETDHNNIAIILFSFFRRPPVFIIALLPSTVPRLPSLLPRDSSLRSLSAPHSSFASSSASTPPVARPTASQAVTNLTPCTAPFNLTPRRRPSAGIGASSPRRLLRLRIRPAPHAAIWPAGSHHHRSRGKPSPSQPANQFALAAAAAAAVPSRTQTPTLSAAAAAAALHASPRQITSPAAVVTRRMERRGSISSITSAPPGHPVARRGSDASMTERIGWLRSDEASAPSSGRPGSRGGSPAASSPPVKQTTGKRAVSHDRVPSNTSEPSRRAPKQAAKRPAPRTHEEDHRQSADEPRKVSRPRKAPTKPRASSDPPVPSLPPAVRAAVAVAAPARKQQQKPKPKPKPEPVYSSSGNEDDSSSLPSDSEPEPQHPPTVHLKKSLRGPPADAANKKKKNVPTHSDAQGSMLARGTMRTTVRDDMVTVVEAAKERQRQNGTRPARSNSASQASHAPHKPQETDVGHSDAVMALALQLMREQQAQTAGKPVLLPSKRAKKRMRRVEEPDAAADEDDGAFIPDEAGDDSDIYRRNSYAGSVHSVASYQSDLESIPEEYSDDDGKKKKKKKKKGKGKRQQGRESVIVPGKDGVPALPNNPLLDQERERLARIRSPEPAQSKTVERKRTLEKLTGESPVPQKTAVNPPLPLPVEPSVPPASPSNPSFT